MIAFSLLYEKRKPQDVSGKYFGIPFCQVSHNPPGSKSYDGVSWGAPPDQKAKPGLSSLGSSFLNLGSLNH